MIINSLDVIPESAMNQVHEVYVSQVTDPDWVTVLIHFKQVLPCIVSFLLLCQSDSVPMNINVYVISQWSWRGLIMFKAN